MQHYIDDIQCILRDLFLIPFPLNIFLLIPIYRNPPSPHLLLLLNKKQPPNRRKVQNNLRPTINLLHFLPHSHHQFLLLIHSPHNLLPFHSHSLTILPQFLHFSLHFAHCSLTLKLQETSSYYPLRINIFTP